MTTNDMNVLDPSGHSRTIWDPDKPAEVEAARVMFNTLTAKGYRAFRVKRNGEEGERMMTFDPEAESMILTPALQGG